MATSRRTAISKLCSIGTDNPFRYISIQGQYTSTTGSYYTLETHLLHLGEWHAGDRVQVLTQVLGAYDMRLHVSHVVRRESDQSPGATGEQMPIHISASSGRSAPLQELARPRAKLTRAHAQLALVRSAPAPASGCAQRHSQAARGEAKPRLENCF
ncbi:thioesterase family protein [Bradyrhizobium ivorense]|uniref:thioesterase family protein n=1 Tax=Bradyrhizobium ivorense TaxID=2511166 RepID=UPI0035573A0C